ARLPALWRSIAASNRNWLTPRLNCRRRIWCVRPGTAPRFASPAARRLCHANGSHASDSRRDRMTVEIKVPSVGEAIVEGTIARWLKKNGDTVRIDEPLFELETDKATTEVGAPAAGQLAIQIPDGQTVAIGSVVGRIDTDVAAKADQPKATEKEPVAAPAALA